MLGCPFHGAVIDGKLTLPNTDEMDYPQPFAGLAGVHGNVQRIRNPTVAAIARTPDQQARDLARGYRWKDYNLVSAESTLCGQRLDPLWHIYIDGNGIPWEMTHSYSVTEQGVHVNLTLVNAFGRVPKQYEDINTSLISQTFSLPNGETDFTVFGFAPNVFRVERNSTGSVMLLHLYKGEFDEDELTDATRPNFPYDIELAAIYKIDISGNGNYQAGPPPIGTGISASVSLYKDEDDLAIFTQNYTGYTEENPVFTCWGAFGGCTSTVDLLFDNRDEYWTKVYRIVFDSNDQEVELKAVDGTRRLTTVHETDVTDCHEETCYALYKLVRSITYYYRVYRDSELVLDAGDVVEDFTETKEHWGINPNAPGSSDHSYSIFTFERHWKGVLIRKRHDTITIENNQPDTSVRIEETPVDFYHSDGDEIYTGFAFLSPQVLAVNTMQYHSQDTQTYHNFIGPSCAAEAQDSHIEDITDLSFGWWGGISGSYEPEEKQLTVKFDGKVCYV